MSKLINDRITQQMEKISNAFIKAGISSMCLYGSALLLETLAYEGLTMQLVSGYLQTNRGLGELYRHVWLEFDGQIYDVSLEILKKVSWKSSTIGYRHHKVLPKNLQIDLGGNSPKTPFSPNGGHGGVPQPNPEFERGILLYKQDPFTFWAEFDNSSVPEIHKHVAPVINKLRDEFLGLD